MTDHSTLRAALLAAVPADGSAIGNQSLLERLRGQHPQLDEERFRALRDVLVAEGLLARGRGRGGAVRRTSGAGPDAASLAEQALNQARTRFAPAQVAEVSAGYLDSAVAEPVELAGQPAKKPGRKAAAPSQAGSTLQELEKTLWATADKLRANMDAAEYKHIVLGLIFLKYISDSFAGRRAELERKLADDNDDYYLGDDDPEALAAELEDRDYYREVNVFWVPEVARWEAIRAAAKQVDIGKRIDDALSAIWASRWPRVRSWIS